MRLDKFFSEVQVASRSQVRLLLKQGAIKVNDIPGKAPDHKIDPKVDKITLDDRIIEYKPFVYIMLNKPKGVVSATNDKINKTVLDLVPPELFRDGLFPAGRLDKETEGFVLITNDGDYSHKMLSPKNHIEKTYHATVDAPVTDEGLKQLVEGVVLADGTNCSAVSAKVIENGSTPVVEIVLCEGKYHQIKRMFGVIGVGVNELKRTKIGSVSLDVNLPLGACREILDKELNKILGKKG